ncbi:Mediator of RNA polymerase II transcription subunit 13 [Colletotrichum chlorophyti]|uniref:Mediator of RNA polymerase II transcription subunit 13 n=1 Tax=Colletotrichum chlorophyti TaxID=708187 RepID=A0A1Q8RLK8_9PEZI|nr:Mediator of RNA polymerase II transcription subunit 13 [Colletotrichum chlorophyti]
MDTSDYDTNTLLNNNISSIAFRVYEPSQEQAQTFPSAAADIETELRSRGHIIFYDATKRVVWYFYVPRKDAAPSDNNDDLLGSSVEAAGATLLTVEEGSFEPISLFKGRMQGQQAANTPTSSSSSSSALDASLRNPPTTSSDSDVKSAAAGVSDIKSICSVALKDAYEQFITAVLSTILASFCNRTAAIPLNNRTVLLPAKVTRDGQSERAHDMETAVVGTFRLYLTTTGALVMSLSLSCCEGLLSVNEPLSPNQIDLGSQILAAPFGVLANYQGFMGGGLSYPELGLGQTPDAQLWRNTDARSSQWRDTCIKILQSRGLSPALLQSCPWIALQMIRRKPGDFRADGKMTPLPSTLATISWPAVLCFRKKSVLLARNNGLGDSVLVAQDETSDFLGEARTWFQLGVDREEIVAKRRKEREAAASKEIPAALPTQQANGHSPIGLRRASNAATAGAMYPTPPDGVQNPLGITSSIDGTTSSPGAPGTTMAMVDIDTTMADGAIHEPVIANSGHHSETYGDGWNSNENKRERADSFLADENDNLFGDIGPDMFGDADITDADFNFFDEEGGDGPDLSGLSDLNMADAPGANAILPAPVPEPAKAMVPAMETKPQPSPPVFAKPELKHARSSLMDEGKQKSTLENAAGVKRESSPFDPDTVYKRVRASLGDIRSTPSKTPARKGSVFDSVDFDPVLPLVNKKYEQGGRFDCSPTLRGLPQEVSTQSIFQGPPTTDYLRRHGKHRKSLKPTEHTSALIRTITGNLEHSSLRSSPGKLEDLASDADDISLVSDLDDSSVTSDEPTSPFKSSIRRLNVDDDVVSHVTSLKDIESVEDSDPALALELPKLAKAEASEVLITKYFEDAESLPIYLSLPDEDLITIAQIVTEQASTGILKVRDAHASTLNTAIVSESRRQLSSLSRNALQTLRQVIPAGLGDFKSCNFRGVVDVPDVPLLGPPNRLHTRPANPRENAEPPKPNNLFQIPAPHMELRRAEARLSVLPASIQFWESLGLGPAQGTKDVNVVCVFPHWDGMMEIAAAFLDRMRNVYELLKLGSFERLPSSAKVADGLVPFEADKIATSPGTVSPHIVAGLADRMEALNQGLLSVDAAQKNFLIYFVYPPDHPGSIVEACTAFQQLFEMYRRSLIDRRQTPVNELVLQLVPLDFLTSPAGMVEPTPSETMRLAIETYDRCTLFGGPMPSPAIMLEQALPRGIDFKLTNTSSSSLMHENTCIHIAYAQSIDERWITAAWTDNRGCQQMAVSYNLGRKGKPLSTSLNDVCHEIWETTHDLISKWKVHWRVVISKCGFMDAQEIAFWQGLAQTESAATVSLTLISVDTNPSLQLIPPAIKVAVTASSTFYSTPVSTPQASILSPEQSGTPVTPMKDNPANAVTPGGTPGDGAAEPAEGDAILLDVTDQTWGAVLAHRLSNSSSPGELNPALISGYLVKRGGTKLEDPPVAMEVNIVHADNNPRMYEPLMREMLTYFRGLGTLARARGIVDRATDIRPWHIAAAEKGVRALYLLM